MYISLNYELEPRGMPDEPNCTYITPFPMSRHSPLYREMRLAIRTSLLFATEILKPRGPSIPITASKRSEDTHILDRAQLLLCSRLQELTDGGRETE